MSDHMPWRQRTDICQHDIEYRMCADCQTEDYLEAMSEAINDKCDHDAASFCGKCLEGYVCEACFGEGVITVENFNDPESFECPVCKAREVSA